MDDGVYCSTANAHFQDRESLSEHYQSEFHRYNLKRKIAGLPPVTKDWYEARRAQLLASSSGALQRIWLDPLSKKKFYSENTYTAFTRSKKYQDLVRKSGKPAPAAVVTIRRVNEENAPQAQPSAAAPASNKQGYTIKPAIKTAPQPMETSQQEEEEEDSGSDWETASEEEMEGSQAGDWEEWNINQSLFDNRMSSSMEENLEYMWKKFGFYLPDSEFLTDPEGLLKYLGAKLKYGHIPLYESGDNANAKQFTSLHGVQRHMVDSGRCKVFYDGNEDEYEDFYDYEREEGLIDGEGRGVSNALILGGLDDAVSAGGGFELAVPYGGGLKILGSREFARYYKQRHKGGDRRESAAAARVVAQYRKLSVPLLGDGSEGTEEIKRAERAAQRFERQRLAVAMRRNVNDNLPRNVPY